MPRSSVYLYQAGIADFRQVRKASTKGSKVSIPVKETQVSDVLATIDYFGPIKLTKPPAFASKNQSSSLKIDPSDPFGSALTAFSGAQVSIVLKGMNASGDVDGTLAGCETVEEVTGNGTTVPKKFVGVYTSEGFRQFSLRDEIRAIKWVNDADKAEFDRALARNYQKIKPGSTFIDLTLTSTLADDTDAILQYALPVASWTMSYRLKRNEQKQWVLDGHAVVHNSTDFDWTDYDVSVVTGEPTTFEHNLAEAIQPVRQKVNVITARARGAVKAEQGSQLEATGGGRQYASKGISRRGTPMMLAACAPAGGSARGLEAMTEGMAYSDSEEDASFGTQAEMDMAEASSAGDFLILTSKTPADIPSNQSALVPMFSTVLSEAERVFYYRPSEDDKHPYSAVKFRNTTGMPLASGVITVGIDNHFSGEDVFEATRMGDERVISHSFESGIKIIRNAAKIDHPLTSIRINEGNLYTEQRSISAQEYTIENKLEEDASVYVEHPWNVKDSDVQVMVDGKAVTGLEKIKSGIRFTIQCSAGQTRHVLVRENKLSEQKIALDGHQFNWVIREGYFSKEGDFAKIATIQEEIQRVYQEKQELQNKRNALQSDQARYNGFLPNAAANKERWETAIAKAEDEIAGIDKQVPAKDQQIKDAQDRLTQALKKLRGNWVPKTAKAVA